MNAFIEQIQLTSLRKAGNNIWIHLFSVADPFQFYRYSRIRERRIRIRPTIFYFKKIWYSKKCFFFRCNIPVIFVDFFVINCPWFWLIICYPESATLYIFNIKVFFVHPFLLSYPNKLDLIPPDQRRNKELYTTLRFLYSCCCRGKDPYKDIVPLCKQSWDTISQVARKIEQNM